MREIKLYLEDSNTVKELKKEILDLREALDKAEAKALKFHDALINEMHRNLILEDKIREYERDFANR